MALFHSQARRHMIKGITFANYEFNFFSADDASFILDGSLKSLVDILDHLSYISGLKSNFKKNAEFCE